MLILYTIIIINTPEEFSAIKAAESYALNSSIELSLNLREFSGTLNGARAVLTLNLPANIPLFNFLSGEITNLKIIAQTTSQETGTYSIVKQADSPKMTSVEIQMKFNLASVSNAKIMPFNIILGIKLNKFLAIINCQIKGDRNSIFGLTDTIQNSCETFDAVIEFASNVAGNIAGIASLVRTGVQINVVGTMTCSTCYGGFINAEVEIKHISVNLTIAGQLIFGLVNQGLTVSNVVVALIVTQENSQNIFNGIGLITSLINSQIQINIQINTGTAEILGIGAPSSIENVVFLLKIDAKVTDFKYSTLGQLTSTTAKILNFAIKAQITVTSDESLEFFGILKEINVLTVSNSLFQLNLTANSILNCNIAGIAYNLKQSFSVANCTILANFQGQNGLIFAAGIGIFGVSGTVMSNTIQLNLSVTATEQLQFGGLMMRVDGSQFQRNFVQIHVDITSSGSDSIGGGIAAYSGNTLINFTSVYGTVKIDSWGSGIIAGIVSQLLTNCVIENSQVNVSYYNEKSYGECFASFVCKIKDPSSKISKSVSYSKNQFSVLVSPCVPTGLQYQLIYEREDSSKNCSIGCVNDEFLKSVVSMGQLINTKLWNIDINQQQGFVTLVEWFFIDENGKFTYVGDDSFTDKPFPHIQDLPSTCIVACHGSGNFPYICEESFTGENCDQIDCSKYQCENGGICTTTGCQCSNMFQGPNCEDPVCPYCFEEQSCVSEFQQCVGQCELNCPGTCANNFCICPEGQQSIASPCDSFKCVSSADCNGYECLNERCECLNSSTDNQCFNCAEDYIKYNDTCRLICIKGFCQYGIDCVFLSEVTWICNDCILNHTGDDCSTCETDFILFGEECQIPCEACLSGNCFFTEECPEKDPVNCTFTCETCIDENIHGETCQECHDGIFFDWTCNEKLEDLGGECFSYISSYYCLSCDVDYVLLENKCYLVCLDDFCSYGNDCIYHGPNKTDTWTCSSCQEYHIGEQCDQCEDNMYPIDFQCRFKCDLCLNGDCYFMENCTSNDPEQCKYQCVTCADIIIQDDQCNQCPDGYQFSQYQCCEEISLNGSCLQCVDNIECLVCDEGFVLKGNLCLQQCSSNICVHGICISETDCLCEDGYQNLIQLCDSFNCSASTEINPCENGFCDIDNCKCNKNFTLDNNQCVECPIVSNGDCNQDEIICQPGFILPNCDNFHCKSDIECENNTCNSGICDCKPEIQQYKGYCLQDCGNINFSQIQILTENLIQEIQHGSIYQYNISKNENIKSNLCVISCKFCRCNNLECNCSQNVVFQELGNGKICVGCEPPFSGQFCDQCPEGQVMVNNSCLQQCVDCNGECFTDENGELICYSCDKGYVGERCEECDIGYIQLNGVCLLICETCNGLCYYNESNIIICDVCYDGYIGDQCDKCDIAQGFVDAFDGCYVQCLICVQGDCYYIQDSLVCLNCTNSLLGTSCDNCEDGKIMHDYNCLDQIGNDSCYYLDEKLICIKCQSDKVLYDEQCYERCQSEICQGECLINGSNIFCISCHQGYILINNQCLLIEEVTNGICSIIFGQKICDCIFGYAGDYCEICIGEIINEICYIPQINDNGDCYKNANQSNDQFCKSCEVGYSLKLCVDCAQGYGKDNLGSCSICKEGFINSSTLPDFITDIIGFDHCIIKCDSCLQGDCYYDGDNIICASCNLGYTGTCFQCQNELHLFGQYCISQGDCGSELISDQTYCNNCDNTMQSFNCSYCTLEYSFDICRNHSLLKGRCYIENDFDYCESTETCLIRQNTTCIQCNTAMININGSCYINLPPADSQYRGTCYEGEEIICDDQCDLGWSGDLCNRCDDDHILCNCIDGPFNYCCCELINRDVGICLNYSSDIVCLQCNSGYKLTELSCLKIKSSKQIIIPLVLSIFVLVLIIILVITWFKLSQKQKFAIQIKLKKFTMKIGFKTFYVILAQGLSMITALQDIYIQEFYLQASVSLISSIPFVLYLFLAQLPSLRVYFYNKSSDVLMFMLVVFFEVLFFSVHYFFLPEQLNISEPIYKLAAPPVTLCCFVFFATFKFTKNQKIVIFAALILPLVFQFSIAIADATEPSFFVDSSPFTIISGQLLIGVNILFISAQFYLIGVVLDTYCETNAITRLAFSSFLIFGIIFIIKPSQIIEMITSSPLIARTVIMQLIFNIVDIFIMTKISTVEFAINSISSSVYAEFINEIGTIIIQKKNYISSSYLNIVVILCCLFIVFAALIIFNLQENKFNNRQNMKSNQRKVKNGVTSRIRSRRLNKIQFKKAILVDSQISVAQQQDELRQLSINSSKILGNSSVMSSRLTNSSVLLPQVGNSQSRVYHSYKQIDTSGLQKLTVRNYEFIGQSPLGQVDQQILDEDDEDSQLVEL